MAIKFLAVVILVKIAIYAFQSAVSNIKIKNSFIRTFVSCDFCLGCWAYWVGLWVFELGEIQGLPYIPILSEFLWGIAVSFIVHLISLGWKAKFETIVID